MEKKTGNNVERWEQVYHFIKGYATKHKLRNTLIALSLAVQYHEGDYRDSGEPYIIHPLMVAQTLIFANIEKTLKEWYQIPEKQIRKKCDILYATAILHDVVEDDKNNKLPQKGKEFVEQYHLEEEVLENILILTKNKKNYIAEEYFGRIITKWETTLVKIADRANNCSTMQVFKLERMKKNIRETLDYIFPLCREGKVKYPEFSNVITVMKNLIVTSCETLTSLTKTMEIITDEENQYQKTISFIKGASRDGMPNTHKALYIAIKLHENQKRKSGDPFIIHPLRVCSYILSLGIEDDIICAAALLHEITKRCTLEKNGLELVQQYKIDRKVLEIVWKVANLNKLSDKEYYKEIEKTTEALIVKLSNRVHTCTMLADLPQKEIEKYIHQTKEYMVPMCQYGIMHYPQYASMIEIMEYHITSTCNIVESLTKNL